MKGTMRIDCYISHGCTSEDALTKNITKALELEELKADVNFRRISDAEAERLGLRGSPSVLIDGEYILPGEIPGFS
jgi:hypothetical protein